MTNTRRGCSHHSVSLPLRLAKKREFDPAMDILSDIFQRILLLFGDCHRLGIVGGGAVTQLAAVITAPIPYRAVCGQRYRLAVTVRDRDGARQAGHPHRHGAVGNAAVAELAADIAAPAPYAAVGGDRKAVIGAGGSVW